MTPRLTNGGDWRYWYAIGPTLQIGPGIHAPSAFSALLAASLAGVHDQTVIDAGCGAGLVTIAALSAGAKRLVALDRDPLALEITRWNVAATLDEADARRVTTVQADFSRLSEFGAGLIAVNPPQRPTRLLAEVEPDQRHLHEGGGEDGLTTLRTVLRATPGTPVYSTVARVLDVQRTITEPDLASRHAEIVMSAALPRHPSWHPLAGPGPLEVDIWAFNR